MDLKLIKIIQLFFCFNFITGITGFICIGNFNFGCNPLITQPILFPEPQPQIFYPDYSWYYPYPYPPGYEYIFNPTSEPLTENTTKKPTKKTTKKTTKRTTKTPTIPPITFPPITIPPITIPPITIPPVTIPPTNATTPKIPVTTDENTWPWPGGHCKFNNLWFNRHNHGCWTKPTRTTFPPRPTFPSWPWFKPSWNRPRTTRPRLDGYWEPFDG